MNRPADAVKAVNVGKKSLFLTKQFTFLLQECFSLHLSLFTLSKVFAMKKAEWPFSLVFEIANILPL